MDLDGIAVFVKVVQVGSFTQAAHLLGMPKTTVSAKVATLEKRLGITLIQRTTRKLHVTEAGMVFFKRCVRALEEVQAGEQEITSGQEAPRGLLRITAPADLGHTVLPPIVQAYLKKYPGTEIELLVTNRIVDLIAEGVDLAIRAGQLKDSSMIAKKFFAIDIGFWATPAYLKKHGSPMHPKELDKHQLITHLNFKDKPLELTDGKAKATVKLMGRVGADDFQTIKVLTLANEGIAWIPNFFAEKEQSDGDLVRVLPKWSLATSGHFSFVYPEQRYVSPKVRAFMSISYEVHAASL